MGSRRSFQDGDRSVTRKTVWHCLIKRLCLLYVHVQYVQYVHVFARVYALFMRVEKFPVAFRFHIAITGKGEWNSVNYRVLKCIWHPALHYCFIIVISMMSNMPYSISETLCHVLSTHSHSHLSF